jgi:hypothetical protein
LEIKAATTPWADRHAAHHRNTRRALVEICAAIQEQLALMSWRSACSAVSRRRSSLPPSQIRKPYGLPIRQSRAAISKTMTQHQASTRHKSRQW